jgi:hypothetical protein
MDISKLIRRIINLWRRMTTGMTAGMTAGKFVSTTACCDVTAAVVACSEVVPGRLCNKAAARVPDGKKIMNDKNKNDYNGNVNITRKITIILKLMKVILKLMKVVLKVEMIVDEHDRNIMKVDEVDETIKNLMKVDIRILMIRLFLNDYKIPLIMKKKDLLK